jgi:cytochrome c oxidase subunit 1
VHFGLTFVAANCTFYPMHILGVRGMPRRYAMPADATYLHNVQWLNTFITVSAYVMGAATLIFVVNFAYSLFFGKKAGRNPWKANSLEWSAPSPPPHGNFEWTPIVVRGPYEFSDPEYAAGDDHAMQAANFPDEHEPMPAKTAPVHA